MAKSDDKQTEMLLEVVKKQQEQIAALLAVKGAPSGTAPVAIPSAIPPPPRPQKRTLPEKVEIALRLEPCDPRTLAQHCGESHDRVMEAVRALEREDKAANINTNFDPVYVWRMGPAAAGGRTRETAPKELKEYIIRIMKRAPARTLEIALALGYVTPEMRGPEKAKAQRRVENAIGEILRTPGIRIEKHGLPEGTGHGLIYRIDDGGWENANTGPKVRSPKPADEPGDELAAKRRKKRK